jgi:DNA-binding LacI/PurR family transcriptional regulator
VPGRIVTSVEVAHRAGVSRSAVSRCFTPGASIAPDTRDKVMRAAKALGYRPNAIARSLIAGRSRMIAVVIGYMENQFYPALIDRLARELQDLGYRLLLFTGAPDGPSDALFAEILGYRVDGMILASTLLSSALAEECRAAGVPVVLVNRTTDSIDISSVAADNGTGARAVAEFLLAAGHRRFGYVAGIASSSTNQDREAAFRDRLAEAGIDAMSREDGGYTQQGARDAALRMLTRPDRPDAIFCANDHMAIAVMDAARFELGLRIPDDVSIVGYDDVGPAAWPSYGLTTVEQPVEAMVRAAVETLMARIAGERAPERTIRIPGELVVRCSARRPAHGIVGSGGRDLWRPQSLPRRAS